MKKTAVLCLILMMTPCPFGNGTPPSAQFLKAQAIAARDGGGWLEMADQAHSGLLQLRDDVSSQRGAPCCFHFLTRKCPLLMVMVMVMLLMMRMLLLLLLLVVLLLLLSSLLPMMMTTTMMMMMPSLTDSNRRHRPDLKLISEVVGILSNVLCPPPEDGKDDQVQYRSTCLCTAQDSASVCAEKSPPTRACDFFINCAAAVITLLQFVPTNLPRSS